MGSRLLFALLLVIVPAALSRNVFDSGTNGARFPDAVEDIAASVGRSILDTASYRLDTVSNANMKPLHGQAVSDPACCTAGVHLTYCFVRWVNGFVHYRRVGTGETWKSLGMWVVGGVTCVAHGSDVTVVAIQGISGKNPPIISNTIRGGRPHGWKQTGGRNAREVPGCTVKGTEIYCMYRGLKCGAYLIHTVKGAWQPVKYVGGLQYSPIAAWYTAGHDEFNYYATNHDYHMEVYGVKGTSIAPWRQEGTFVMTGRASVCSHAAKTIDVFTLGPGSNLLWLQRNAAGKYLGWKNLGGQINYPPACIGRLNGINCFGVSPKHEFVRKIYKGNKWTKWTTVAGGYDGTPSCHFSIAGVNIISCYVRNLKTGIDAFAFIA